MTTIKITEEEFDAKITEEIDMIDSIQKKVTNSILNMDEMDMEDAGDLLQRVMDLSNYKMHMMSMIVSRGMMLPKEDVN